MGLYDREYYREEPRRSFIGGTRTMVTNLLLVNFGVFLVDILFFQGRLSDRLALQSDMLTRPWEAWQLLSYGFAHSTQDIWHILSNMFVLWLFGREIEGIYGRREFLCFYLSTLLLAGVAWSAVQVALFPESASRVVGASGGCMGVALVYAFHFPKRLLYLYGVVPIPVWLIIGFFVAKDLLGFTTQLQTGTNAAHIAFEGHLAGAACGALFFKTRWHLGRLLSVFGGVFSRNPLKRRPRLRVHRDEHEADGLSDQVDTILKKISREGEQSLSAKERRILEDASRRYQRRDR